MGLGVTAQTASTKKVKAEVTSDMVHTHLRVLYLDTVVPAKRVLGLSSHLEGLVANGHLVEHLNIVEALQSYPLLQWKRGQGRHHSHKHWPFAFLCPGGGSCRLEFHQVFVSVQQHLPLGGLQLMWGLIINAKAPLPNQRQPMFGNIGRCDRLVGQLLLEQGGHIDLGLSRGNPFTQAQQGPLHICRNTGWGKFRCWGYRRMYGELFAVSPARWYRSRSDPDVMAHFLTRVGLLATVRLNSYT